MYEAPNLINITESKALYDTYEIDTLKELLRECENRYGDHIAFRFRNKPHDQTESKTYREFALDVNSFGSALLELGLAGTHIAIIGENRYEWIVSYFATVNGVGVAVPLDKALPQNEIENLLERGEIDVLIYSDGVENTVKGLAAGNTRLKTLICMNPEQEPDKPGFYSFRKLLKRGRELINKGYNEYKEMAVDPDIMKILLFTSGTSADSKAVMLSHRNICADILGLGGIVYFPPGKSVLSILPLSHTFENTTGMLFPLYLGMTIAICDGLKYFSKNLTEYQPDCLVGVPLIFDKFKSRISDEVKKKGLHKKVKLLMKIANVAAALGLDLRRKLFKQLLEPFGGNLQVIVTGGAAVEPGTVNWYESIGIKVYQGYGLTETSPVVAGGNDRRRKTGTCGEPLPGVKLAIANPDAKGAGEIVVSGKNIMLGYWKNEDATKEAIQEGWFHTGDLGLIDKKGFIHVTGRVKSMIVLKNGKKVFPEELESYINKLKFVKESLVWGESASDGTVEICSRIVLDKEQMSCIQTLPDDESGIKKILDSAIRDINRLVPVYKTIRYYVYGYEELVKTTSMKIKRYIETERIRAILKTTALNIKNATGKNIDKLKEMMAKSVENY